MKTTDVFEYQLATGLPGRRRTLRLAPDYVEFENKSLRSDLFTRVEKAHIADIRHDMNWIIWYRFYVGCDFRIDLKTKDDNVLKIRFRSYFGQNSAHIDAYNEITEQLWEYYLQEKAAQYLRQISRNRVVALQGVVLTQQGLVIFREEPPVAWHVVRVKQYPDFYVVYREGQPEKHRQIPFYAWESEMLLSLIKSMQGTREEGTAFI